jgi:hypothetical protein
LRLFLKRYPDCKRALPDPEAFTGNKHVFWLCFDRSNGHPGIRRWVWVYNSKAQAQNHHKIFPDVVMEPVPAVLST